jgi:hypothetical protein
MQKKNFKYSGKKAHEKFYPALPLIYDKSQIKKIALN